MKLTKIQLTEQQLLANNSKDIISLLNNQFVLICRQCNTKEMTVALTPELAAIDFFKKGWRKDICISCTIINNMLAQLNKYPSSHYYIDSSAIDYNNANLVLVGKINEKTKMYVTKIKMLNDMLPLSSFIKRKPNFKKYNDDQTYLGFLFIRINNKMHYCHIHYTDVINYKESFMQPSNIVIK